MPRQLAHGHINSLSVDRYAGITHTVTDLLGVTCESSMAEMFAVTVEGRSGIWNEQLISVYGLPHTFSLPIVGA